MEKECDFLVPAATEKSINKVNAPNLKCKAVAEGDHTLSPWIF